MEVCTYERQSAPFCGTDCIVFTYSIIFHYTAGKGSFGKGTELVDGLRERSSDFVPPIFVAQNPVVVTVFLKCLGNPIRTIERFGERATKAVVVHKTVANTMEHACWGWQLGIFQLTDGAIDTAGIGDNGSRTKRLRQG